MGIIQMKTVEYEHNAKYYETDQMGIIHHSNYIRWMEEARVFYMAKIGFGYKEMEESGIFSPVISVQCNYKKMVHFDDNVTIKVYVKEYKGLKLTIGYEMRNKENDEVCATASSVHCFLNAKGRPIQLKKDWPDFHSKLQELLM